MTQEYKIALVTGASGGIGSAMAMRLASDGYHVAVHYNGSASKAEDVVAAIKAEDGRAEAFQADLSSVACISALFGAVIARFGRLDVFVNNVGIPAAGVSIAEAEESTFDKIFAVNAKGAYFALKEASRHLQDEGRIINISSSTTYFPSPGLSIYSASKAVMQMYTEVLARELGGKGITVNTVVPGPTVPGMFDWAPDDLKKHAASLSPFNRLGAPDDIAGAVAFLASNDARWITGQHLLVNGGATI